MQNYSTAKWKKTISLISLYFYLSENYKQTGNLPINISDFKRKLLTSTESVLFSNGDKPTFYNFTVFLHCKSPVSELPIEEWGLYWLDLDACDGTMSFIKILLFENGRFLPAPLLQQNVFLKTGIWCGSLFLSPYSIQKDPTNSSLTPAHTNTLPPPYWYLTQNGSLWNYWSTHRGPFIWSINSHFCVISS